MAKALEREDARGFDPRIWLLAIGTFAAGTDSFVIAGILPELAKSFHITISAAGSLVSIYALVYGIGTPLLAVITARWRQDQVALGSLLAFVVVNILCALTALAPGLAIMLVLRVLAAICAAVYAPTAYALATAFARPERRGSALAAVALGSSGSTVIGVPLGTFIGQQFGWPETFVMVAAITLIGILALVWRGPRAAIEAPAPQPLAARVKALGRPRIWLVLAPVILMFCAIYIVYTYIVPLLDTHYKAAEIPLYLTIYGLGGLLGSQLGGKLVDSFGAIRPLVILLAIYLLLLVALPSSLASAAATGAILFFITLTTWSCFAPNQTRALAAEPAQANVILALTNSSIFLGAAIGSGLGGVLYGPLPVTDLPYAAAILTAAAVAIVVPDLARKRPPR